MFYNQSRTIVRATTKREARLMLNAARDSPLSYEYLNQHWEETTAPEELAIATERGVWARGARGWVKIWPK
jgi:hypothetical protein